MPWQTKIRSLMLLVYFYRELLVNQFKLFLYASYLCTYCFHHVRLIEYKDNEWLYLRTERPHIGNNVSAAGTETLILICTMEHVEHWDTTSSTTESTNMTVLYIKHTETTQSFFSLNIFKHSHRECTYYTLTGWTDLYGPPFLLLRIRSCSVELLPIHTSYQVDTCFL